MVSQDGQTGSIGLQEGTEFADNLGGLDDWKQCNDKVFNGTSPNVSRAMALVEEVEQLWGLAGARELSHFPAAAASVEA